MTESGLAKELLNAIDTSNVKVPWVRGPKGYFTIRPMSSEAKVFVRYYGPDNTLRYTFKGINTSQLIQEIIRRKLVSKLEHAAYLGKEIEKAILALENNLKYIQDQKLRLKKRK